MIKKLVTLFGILLTQALLAQQPLQTWLFKYTGGTDDGECTQNVNFTGTMLVNGVAPITSVSHSHTFLTTSAATELTIASGAVTAVASAHTIDGEGDADDNLDTINGTGATRVLLFWPSNAARNITVRSGMGNIITSDGLSYTIPDNGWILFVYDGANWRVLSAGGGATYVKADGTVALTASWDAGAYEVRALKFYSDQATGTAPFTVESTTAVTNLNADLLDGYHASDMLTGTSPDNWYPFTFTIRNEVDDDPQHFEIDVDDDPAFGSILKTWDSRDVADGGDGQSGCKYFNGTSWATWTTGTGVTAAYEGQRASYSFQSASVAHGTLYYIRVRFHDGTSWGDYAGDVKMW